MKRPNPLPINREVLYQLYVVERRKVIEVARALRRRNDVVLTALKTFGFLTPVTKDWLEERYVRQGQSVDDIAATLQVGEGTVRYHLRKYHIPIRYKSRGSQRIAELNDPDWLREHYISRTLSLCKIADILVCAESSVERALRRFGIPRRPQPAAVAGRIRTAYRRSFTSRKRRLIYTRDGRCCRQCGSNDRIEAHHIIPLAQGGTNALENGITLCWSCHVLTRGREVEMAPTFQRLAQGPST